MTTPQDAEPPGVEAAGGGVEAVAHLLERLADRLGARASVTAVFGEPIVSDDVTVIPVARVGFGFGGGGGRQAGATRTAEGGGGGGGAEARPLGFIEIKNGVATYRPIRDPWTDVIIPIAALLVGGASPKALRLLTRLRRRSWTATTVRRRTSGPPAQSS